MILSFFCHQQQKNEKFQSINAPISKSMLEIDQSIKNKQRRSFEKLHSSKQNEHHYSDQTDDPILRKYVQAMQKKNNKQEKEQQKTISEEVYPVSFTNQKQKVSEQMDCLSIKLHNNQNDNYNDLHLISDESPKLCIRSTLKLKSIYQFKSSIINLFHLNINLVKWMIYTISLMMRQQRERDKQKQKQIQQQRETYKQQTQQQKQNIFPKKLNISAQKLENNEQEKSDQTYQILSSQQSQAQEQQNQQYQYDKYAQYRGIYQKIMNEIAQEKLDREFDQDSEISEEDKEEIVIQNSLLKRKKK